MKNLKDDFIKSIVAKSKTKQWYQIIDTLVLDGVKIEIRIKGFEKWLQVFELNGIKHECSNCKTQKDMVNKLNMAFDYVMNSGGHLK